MAHFNFHTTGNEIVDAFVDRVRDRTFLVTGPSADGIGAETAFSLAKAHPKLLILAGRSQSKIQPVIDYIGKTYPETKTAFITIDLASQASTRQAVEDVKALGVTIDVLINNAAVMACPYWKTSDGIEMQFGTNQAGPFLFTNLLLKAGLISTKGGRVVVVSSSASVQAPSVLLQLLDDLTYDDGNTYVPPLAYSVSKLANVLYARSLAQKVQRKGITVLSLNPGSIKTPLQRYFSPADREKAIEQAKKNNPDFVMPEPKSLQEGCSTQLRCALDPTLESSSGAYLHDCQVVEFPQHVGAYGAVEKVWKICEEMVGESFDFSG